MQVQGIIEKEVYRSLVMFAFKYGCTNIEKLQYPPYQGGQRVAENVRKIFKRPVNCRKYKTTSL